MANFNLALSKVLLHEGGYVNDPDDLGGETYKGISRKSHPTWEGWLFIDQCKPKPNFPKSLDEVKKLKSSVEQFYFDNFWKPLKADLILNQTSAESIFDFAVNAGIKISVQLTQHIVLTKTDGIMGEKTLSGINAIDDYHFQACLTVAKLKFYLYTIRRRPTNKKFLLGWLSRSIAFND